MPPSNANVYEIVLSDRSPTENCVARQPLLSDATYRLGTSPLRTQLLPPSVSGGNADIFSAHDETAARVAASTRTLPLQRDEAVRVRPAA
jgi:hypothetical protein